MTSGPHVVVSGSALTLGGALLSGASEGSGGSTQSSPTNYPLMQLQSADGGALTFVAPSAWSATSLTVPMSGSLPNGPHWLRVIVSGVPSAAWQVTVVPPLLVSPTSVTLAPKASQTFTASGGSGAGYTWTLATNASGGTLAPSTGAYTAGAIGGVTDVVEVKDSLGNTTNASVSVTAAPQPGTGNGGGCGCGNGGRGSSLLLLVLGALSLSRPPRRPALPTTPPFGAKPPCIPDRVNSSFK